MSRSFQVLSQCPSCKIDAVLVEAYDDAIAQGIPVSKKCSFCGYEEELLNIVSHGESWATPEMARKSLIRWAQAEGSSNVDLFCE